MVDLDLDFILSKDPEPRSSRTPEIQDFHSTTPKKNVVEKKNKTPIKFSKTGEDIYNRGKEFLTSVEQKRQEKASKEHSFKPKINEKSQKMLKNAIKEGRNPRDKKPKEEQKVEEEVVEEEKKVKPKGDIKGFIERNYKNALVNKKGPEKEEELDSECTFKPRISDKSKEMAGCLHSDLYKQAEDLKKKKQDKIDEAKKKKEKEELNGCTFHPQISKSYATFSPTGKVKKSVEIQGGYSKSKQHKLFINA